jgi:hypothetical protein
LAIRIAFAPVAKKSTNVHDYFQVLRYVREPGYQITPKCYFLVSYTLLGVTLEGTKIITGPLKGHLDRVQVDQLIHTYDKCFTKNTIEAQFSCDRDYPPLVLTLTEFVPLVGERATVHVITGTIQQGVTFEQRFPATLTLPKLEDDLHQKCLDHIKSIVQHHRDNKTVYRMRYSSEISARVFCCYL